MTSIADRIQVERIAAQAQQLQLWRVFLTLIALPFYALGWALRGVFFVLAFFAKAVLAGWQDADKKLRAGLNGAAG